MNKKTIEENIKLIFSKKGLNLVFKPFDTLSDEDKLRMVIPLSVYIIPFYFCIAYFWFGVTMGLNYLPFFFILCTISVTMVLYYQYYGKLVKKYGNGKYEQLTVIMVVILAPLVFAGGIALGIVVGNFWWGLGFSVSAVFPIFVIFKRIQTFGDDSIPVYEGPKLSIPLDIGYFPYFYWMLSTLLGFQITGRGFSAINAYFMRGTPSLSFAFITIVLGLVFQSIVLFPDKFDRIVPFDLRTKKGFIFMMVLTILLYTASYFILSLFNPDLKFTLY